MSPKGVEQTKSIAGYALIVVFLQWGYSVFEVIRHTVVGDEAEHIMMHLLAAIISGVILLACKQSAYELIMEKIE